MIRKRWGRSWLKKRAEWNPWNFPVARSGVLSGAWSAKIWGKLIPLHFPARAGEKEGSGGRSVDVREGLGGDGRV